MRSATARGCFSGVIEQGYCDATVPDIVRAGGLVAPIRFAVVAGLAHALFSDADVARHSPMIEDVRSCTRENLSRSPALALVSRDLAADEQFQLPLSLLKRSQRKPVLCP